MIQHSSNNTKPIGLDLSSDIPDGFDILDRLPQSVYRVDIDGQLLYANNTLLKQLQLSLEDLAGKTAYDLYPRHLANKYRNDDRHVIQSKQTFHKIEVNIDPVTHKQNYVELYKIPLFNTGGEVIGIQGIFWDITDRFIRQEESKKRESQFRSMAEQSPDYITLLDQNFSVVYANRTLTGASGSSINGCYLPTLLPNEKDTITSCLKTVLRTGDPGRFQTFIESSPSVARHFETHVTLLNLEFNNKESNERRLLLVTRDISHLIKRK